MEKCPDSVGIIISLFFCEDMSSNNALVVGTPSKLFVRDFMFYTAIQATIFVKVIIFVAVFGAGISYAGQPLALDLPFIAMPVFGNTIHAFDYFFHQLMHVLIFFWMFLLAKHVKAFKPLELALLFLLADVMHNIGYWLTYSHPSVAFSIRDFFTDYVALWLFFLLCAALVNFVPFVKKIKLKYFDAQ